MSTTTIPPALARRLHYSGPALFSYGFRPFFLSGAAWAALAVLLWIPQYLGVFALPTAFPPLDWHVHEMLFGYVAAVIAGFLLTAIPNWTGRLPVNGAPLAALALLWLAGRVAMLTSARIGLVTAAVIDVSFLVTLAAVALREILAGQNWRNVRVLAVLAVLIAGNVVFHAEVIVRGAADYGIRIGIAAAVMLVMLIGGRIVPSFTNNWLVRMRPGRLPQPFSRFDAAALGVSAVALIAWIVAPGAVITGAMLVTAGTVQAVRLVRWVGYRTLTDRLVFVLHVAYAFVSVGFVLAGISALAPGSIPPSAAVHAWTAGALGLMPLSVMTRATLGHTGRALIASAATQAIYLMAFLAALIRIVAAISPSIMLIHLAAFAWCAAFAGFVAAYGPLLIRARAK
jgi:uncharacterized protein involved in response to NO